MNDNELLNKLLNDFATVPAKAEADVAILKSKEKQETAIPAQPPADAEKPSSEETVQPAKEQEKAAEPPALPVNDAPVIEEDDKQEPLAQAAVPEPEQPAAEEAGEEPEIKVAPMEAPTQVIPLDGTAGGEQQEDEKDPFDGQMTMADFADEQPEEEPAQPAESAEEISWEEQLEQTRREKIRDFQIQKNRENTDFHYEETEAPDELPAAAAAPAEEEVPAVKAKFTGDFTESAQAADVTAELSYRYRSFKFRLWLAAIAEILLLWSEGTVLFYGVPTVTPSLFLLVNIAGLSAIIALLFPMLRDGAITFFRLKFNAETIPAVIAAVIWVHAMLQWFRLPAVETGEAPLLTAVGGLLLLLCGIGRLLRISRIRLNFAAVGKEGEKVAAAMVQEERTAIEIGRRAVATGIPRVVYFRPVHFLDDFLANSYMDDRYDVVLRRYIPCAGALALVAGILYGVLTADAWNGVTMFAALLCVLLPAASLALNVPMWKECKRQLQSGNMLCGFAAAERFGDVHGVALDVSDLYLHDSVMLHGIRTFGATRIDEAIMDAAAVAIRAEGPLAGLFLRIIEGKTEILQTVDNLVFEQDMGFSGWVGGRRVLVGNRKLLDNHGVDTPSGDYERKYKKDGRELVYLSVAGELSAMFIISYVTDEVVETALHELQDARVSLLIRSCDPNVTEESLCAGFRLDDFYVDLLSASAGRLYDNLRHREEDRVSAGAAVNGTVQGIAKLLTGCKRLRRRGIAAMLVQIVCALIGAIFFFATCVSGGTTATLLPLIMVPVVALLSVIVSMF